jgi:hypothetical protein
MALEGSAEAVVLVSLTAAFAYLSDPRHAGEWFASAGFAVEARGPPRAGQTWSFARTAATRRELPVRTEAFEPPSWFVWRTQLGALRTNNEWELRVEPASVDTDGSGGVGGGREGSAAGAATRLRLTLRLRPGPLGWLATLPLVSRMRGILEGRAQTAVTHAAEAAEQYARDRQGKQGNPKTPGRTRRSRLRR